MSRISSVDRQTCVRNSSPTSSRSYADPTPVVGPLVVDAAKRVPRARPEAAVRNVRPVQDMGALPEIVVILKPSWTEEVIPPGRG